MALSNVALFGAAFLTPVLAGKITHSLGWEWTFYLVAIFSAACLPLTIFLVPETAFRRPDCLDTDRNSTQHEQDGTAISAQPKNNEDGPSQGRHLETEAEKTSTAREGTREQPSIISEEDASAANNERNQTTRASERVSYLQTLKPFNGRKTDENFFKLLLRPFPLFFHPAVLWVGHSINALVTTCQLT